MHEWFDQSALSLLRRRNQEQVDPFCNLIASHERLVSHCKSLEERNQDLHRQLVVEQSVDKTTTDGSTIHLKEKLHQLQEELSKTYKGEATRAKGDLQLVQRVKELEDLTNRQHTELLRFEKQVNDQRDECKTLQQLVEQEKHSKQVFEMELLRVRQILVTTEHELEKIKTEYGVLCEKMLKDKVEMIEQMNRMNETALTDVTIVTEVELAAETSRDRPSKLRHQIKAHATEINSLVFNASGSMVLTGSSDSTIRVWDTHTAQVRSDFRARGSHAIMAVDISMNGDLVLGASSDRSCHIWAVATGRSRHTLTGHSGKVMAGVFSANARHVVTGSSDRCIKRWDLHNGYCTSTLNGRSTCHDLALTMSDEIVASAHQDGGVKLWDFRTSTLAHEIASLHGQHVVTSVAYSKDNLYFASCGKDNLIQLVDTRTYRPVETFSHAEYRVPCNWAKLAFVNDFIVAGSANGKVFVWHSKTKREEIYLEHDSAVICCAGSNASDIYATGDKNGSLFVWD